MARRTGMIERERTTNDLLNDRFWMGNVKRGSISLRSLRNFAKMCKAIDNWSNKTAFTAKDLGVSAITLNYANDCKIIQFNKLIVEETRTEYQQVDNPDKRMVVTRRSKKASYHPTIGVDYKALAEAVEEYVINQIKNI
jgi:hypothetical protein